MNKFDIAFSLNRSIVIEAQTYEEAEKQLKQMIEKEGVDLEEYELEVFDVVEE